MIRFGVVALVAFGLQTLVIEAPLGIGDPARRVANVLTYVLLLGFVLANLRRPGLVLMGVGALLNLIAILGNGGYMAVSPATLDRADLTLPAGVSPGDWVPGTKDVLLPRGDTHFWFLTDVLVWKNPTSVRAFSPGDVLIGLGLLATLAELFLPRLRRPSADRPSLP